MTDVIKFNRPNFEAFWTGKVSTVRLGVKNRMIGEEVFPEDEDSGEKIEATVRKVEYIMAIDLTKQHAINDGFPSARSLRAELEECYGKGIAHGDVLTVITFNCVGGTLV